MNSFRLRIALANATVSGILLVSLALASLVILYNLKIRELRDDISELARRGFPVFHHMEEYQNFGYRMEEERRRTGEGNFLLLMLSRDGATIYQSETWPGDIRPEDLPANQMPVGSMASNALFPRPSPGPNPGPGPAEDQVPWIDERIIPPAQMGPPGPPRQMPGGGPGREQFRLVEFKTVGTHSTGWLLGIFQGPRITLAVTTPITPVFGEVKAIAYAFFLSLPFALVLLIITSYWLSGKAIKPVRDLTLATESIDAQSLKERVVLKDADLEFTRLARVFNAMLERLEKSFVQAKRFSSDAAHELKTPLSVLQGELDLAMQHCKEGSALQQKLSDLSGEVVNLSQIVSRLLYLSQADAGKLPVSRESFDFAGLIGEIVDDAQLTAPDLRFRCDLEHTLPVHADPMLVGQIIHNLVSNAIRYNRKDGLISINLRKTGASVVLDVQNTGKSIPQEAVPRIFERFFRSGNSGIPGSGLGLSLAQEFARAHNGQLILHENREDRIVFRLTLPA